MNTAGKISFLILLQALAFCQPAFSQPREEEYMYRQTRDQIEFVKAAARLFEKEGRAAFPELRKKGGRWFTDERYIFIYDLSGRNVFHPVDPELEGQNLIDVKDIQGKPIIRLLLKKVKEEGGGWVHYLWEDPGEIMPRWKSSYVMKVHDPAGKEYLIGSGRYDMRLEKHFIVATVNAAVELIKKKGTAAFEIIHEPSSEYIYNNTYVFIISEDGKAIVDPSYPNLSGRNLMNLRDRMGKYIVREMIDKLKDKDSAWVIYMWPKPGEAKPSRRASYIRKVRVDGKEYIVGSALFLENPIWLKL